MLNQQLPEREELMEEERVSLFTVKDIGRALGNFLVLTVVYILSVVIYEFDAGWRGILATGWRLFVHSPQFLASATILIISREGGDIVLFHRWAEARRRHAANVAKAKDEGLTEGLSRGRSEGFTEGGAKASPKAERGFTEGRSEGLTEGRNEGLTEGRSEGFTHRGAQCDAAGVDCVERAPP